MNLTSCLIAASVAVSVIRGGWSSDCGSGASSRQAVRGTSQGHVWLHGGAWPAAVKPQHRVAASGAQESSGGENNYYYNYFGCFHLIYAIQKIHTYILV